MVQVPIVDPPGGVAERSERLRLLQHAKAPTKALIGPWAHAYPQIARPGPQIGFLQESLRWWDRWLKGIDNGIMEEPQLRLWMQEAVEPRGSYAQRPGRWLAAPAWPAPGVATRCFWLGDGELQAASGEPPAQKRQDWRGSQLVGAAAGVWCPWGGATDFPTDQRTEDGLSLTFTSPPLGERLVLAR